MQQIKDFMNRPIWGYPLWYFFAGIGFIYLLYKLFFSRGSSSRRMGRRKSKRGKSAAKMAEQLAYMKGMSRAQVRSRSMRRSRY